MDKRREMTRAELLAIAWEQLQEAIDSGDMGLLHRAVRLEQAAFQAKE